ncbi:hypothetical protein AYO44_15305 [Planctomycetaceae bacterium SCGC AG-212-F19]|nr:hypothetical protein AYO44_15305 [Planctomycetaceae bacterium SCGC AG-212-F19]
MFVASGIRQELVRTQQPIDPPAAKKPTEALPGSPHKVIVLTWRYETRQPLWHPLGATDGQNAGRRRQMFGNTVQVY